jgi:hypothetical protein
MNIFVRKFPIMTSTTSNRSTNLGSGTKEHREQNFDLMHKVGRLTIPPFDGSTKSMAKAWVHKLDTYLQLYPMTKEEEIKYATLYLEGESHEWWYHGLVTLGHTIITSYVEFTCILMDKFEKKDPEIHFRELAQLRQIGTP